MIKTIGNKILKTTKLAIHYAASTIAGGLVLLAVLFWSAAHWCKDE